VDYGNQQYVADEDMESLMAEAETFLEHGLDASPPVDTEALWTDPHPRTNEGRRMLEDFIQRGPRAWDVRDLGQRICQIENEALAALDGEPTTPAPLDVERLAHKAAEIGFTYGALGRDFEYVYKNVNDMLAAAYAEETK
jgi:hypothetical protein